MRVVICGDSHIGAVYGLGGPNGSGGNTRVDDYERTLNYIVDYCIDNKVDIFIQTGDAFDKRNPAPEHMEIMDRALKKLSLNNIFSAVIMGNHDYKKTGPSFTSSITSLSAKDYPNVRLVIEPQIIEVVSDGKGVNLLLLPFRDRKILGNKGTKEDSLTYESEVNNLIASADKWPIVGVGHNFFYEGSYNDYGGAEVLAKVGAFKGCDLIAMGHYHDFRILKKKDPVAIYTGSMERLNFGDAMSKKVFIDYDSSTKKVKVLEAPCRDLADLTVDLSKSTFENIKEELEEHLTALDIKDKVVRLKVIMHEKMAATLKRTYIERMLYELGAFFVSKVLFEQIYQRMVRDTSILEEKSDFSMFKAFVKNQGFDLDMENRILTEAKEIIE